MNLANYKKLSPLLRISSIALIAIIYIGCNILSHSGKRDQQTSTGQHKSWKQYGGSADQSKYVEFKQITKKNVQQLQVAWTYPTNDDVLYQFNPIIVGNVMYLLAKNNSLIALNATTGKEIWIHANLTGITGRGINYWENKDKTDRRLIITINNTLQEIDASTGKSILAFGKNGFVSLKEGLGIDPATIRFIQPTTPGCVFENLILLGSSPGEALFSPPGHIRAYDIITGKMAWIFHTIPLPGEYGYETWPKDAYKYAGGTNTWGDVSVDEKRGIAYFPTGSPTYDYYGADRIGNNLFSDCLIAIDARTGKRLWHFQTVHHDLWDYDLAAAPQLITVNHNGKKIDAVAQASKNGFLYVFNRVTGEPLWPIEERPVPQSGVPGEKSSPTQPFPTVIPPFSKQGMTAEDVSPYLMTAEERIKLKKLIAASGTGMFQPLLLNRETIALPGAAGSSNVGTTAANPGKGIVYVLGQNYPSIYKLTKASAIETPVLADQVARAKAIYIQNCQSCHGAERTGGVGPSIITAGTRINYEKFKTLVAGGKGQMPGFFHIDERSLSDLYAYLGGTLSKFNAQKLTEKSEAYVMPTGPVVASGGAPLAQPGNNEKPIGIHEYPTGIKPLDQYVTDYGLGYPYIFNRLWSFIVAYDLNKGVIKWKIPLGQDKEAAIEGGKNIGVPNGGQRKGMIVTANGLLFSTAKDSRIYAFDADNGNILWSSDLPGGTEGLPSMYEVNGRQYIIVSVTTPFSSGRKRSKAAKPKGTYIVYALPEK